MSNFRMKERKYKGKVYIDRKRKRKRERERNGEPKPLVPAVGSGLVSA